MADPTIGERLTDFFAGHQTRLDLMTRDMLVGLKQLERRITDMDANVAALTAEVTALTTKVDAALAQVGKLSPADESALAGAVTSLTALGAQIDAVLTPTAGATGTTGPAAPAA